MNGMDERPQQRPEGALIAAALKRARISQREAARRAEMSENRWRAIMHGYQSVGEGVNASVRGPAETLGRMAHVVGVTPEELEAAGRPDAAESLRKLQAGSGRTTREMQSELRRRLAELRTVMDQELGDENRPVRDALFGGLEALVEESSAKGTER